jgi:hypothetical protein
VKRVLKVIGKNEGKKNADFFVFYKDFGDFVVGMKSPSRLSFSKGDLSSGTKQPLTWPEGFSSFRRCYSPQVFLFISYEFAFVFF